MPEPMVREDIEKGRLVRLDMREYKDAFMRLHAIYRTDTPPGPAGSWLIDRFVAQANMASEGAQTPPMQTPPITMRDRRKAASRDRRKRK